MVQTIVTPQNPNFDMQVALPESYVGKKVHVFFYADDEIEETVTSVLTKIKPSDFFGTLSKEEGKKMHTYISKTREEWERDI